MNEESTKYMLMMKNVRVRGNKQRMINTRNKFGIPVTKDEIGAKVKF